MLIATLVQLAIATAKLVAAAVTSSTALLAEGIHTLADVADQLIWLRARGVARATEGGQGEDAGDANQVYFWSLIASTLVLGGGGAACLALGVMRFPVARGGGPGASWAFAALGISAVVEGASWAVGMRKVARARNGVSVCRFLRESRDPALTAVVAQDTAALLGLLLAFLGTLGDHLLGIPWLDPVAAMGVGLTVAGVALLLARERRTLVGSKGAGSNSVGRLRRAIARDPNVAAVGGIWTLQLGPDDLLVSCQIEFRGDLLGEAVEEAIDRVERAARAAEPRASRVLVGVESSRWSASRRPGGKGSPPSGVPHDSR